MLRKSETVYRMIVVVSNYIWTDTNFLPDSDFEYPAP